MIKPSQVEQHTVLGDSEPTREEKTVDSKTEASIYQRARDAACFAVWRATDVNLSLGHERMIRAAVAETMSAMSEVNQILTPTGSAQAQGDEQQEKERNDLPQSPIERGEKLNPYPEIRPARSPAWQEGDSDPAEEWRPVVGYEEQYEVSNRGRLRVRRSLLKQWPSHQGYMIARLSRPRAIVSVHRLVAAAFLKNPDGKPGVNHIDSNRANNTTENLEWCTQAENMAHARAMARERESGLTDDDVREMRTMFASGQYSWQDLADWFGVSKRCVGKVVKGESYAHVG